MFSQKSRVPSQVLWAFLAASAVVVFDQAAKYLAAPHAVINTGMAFSVGEGSSLLTLLLTAFFVLLLTFVSWQLLSERRVYVVAAYGALLGGGFSNLLDRWLYSGVRDIWVLPGLSLTNNAADWAIFLAAIFLIWSEIIPMYSYLWNRR
jgi:lipoprotein signal peptidase